MKMKKTLGILIAASMVLAACGGNSSGTSETKSGGFRNRGCNGR